VRLAGSDAGVGGRRGRGRTQQRRQRLNAAGTVVVGRVRSARRSRCRCAAGGWERKADTQRGRTWVEQRGRAQGLSTVNAGWWMVQWVQWVQRQCRKQRRTRGRPLSSIGRTTEACRGEDSAEAGGDQGVCSMWRVEGVRGARCEVWVRLDERTRTKAVWGSFPTQSSHLQRAIPPWKLSRSANCSRSIFSPPNPPPCQMTCVARRPSARAFIPNCTLPSGCPKLSVAVARRKRVRVPAQRCPRALAPGPAMPVLPARRSLDRAAWPPAALKRLRTHWLTNVCVH
jgi:hypothetical protein